MTGVYGVLFIFILFKCMLVFSEQVENKTQYASITSDLKQFYRASCIYMLNTGERSLEYSETEMIKELTLINTRTTVVNLNILNETLDEIRCSVNRPLIVFFSNQESRQFLENLNKVPSYPRWVVFLEVDTSVDDFVENVYIPFDCEFLAVESGDSGVTLSEVYRIQKDGSLYKSNFGTWDSSEGLVASHLSLYERRNSLDGLVIKGAVEDSAPFNLVKMVDGNTLEISGLLGQLWKILERRLNFTTEFSRPPDGSWGSLKPNGTWTGMVGMVVRHEAHVATAEITMTADRLQAVDFLMPIGSSRTYVFIREPDTITPEWDDFLAPFSSDMWFASLAFIAFVGATLFLVNHVAQLNGSEDIGNSKPQHLLSDSMFQVLGLFCQQGSDVVLHTASSRTVFLMACMTSLVVLAAYSAALMSFLTVQMVQIPFSSLREFVDSRTYRLGVLDRSSGLDLLTKASESFLTELYTKFISKELGKLPATTKIGMANICKENKYALMATWHYAVNHRSKLPCSVVWIPESIMMSTWGMVIQKDSPYRNIINYHLRFLRDSGVLNYLHLKAWPKDTSRSENAFHGIEFTQIVPVLCVMSAGIILGIIFLLVEISTNRCDRNKISPSYEMSENVVNSCVSTQFLISTSTSNGHYRHRIEIEVNVEISPAFVETLDKLDEEYFLAVLN